MCFISPASLIWTFFDGRIVPWRLSVLLSSLPLLSSERPRMRLAATALEVENRRARISLGAESRVLVNVEVLRKWNFFNKPQWHILYNSKTLTSPASALKTISIWHCLNRSSRIFDRDFGCRGFSAYISLVFDFHCPLLHFPSTYIPWDCPHSLVHLSPSHHRYHIHPFPHPWHVCSSIGPIVCPGGCHPSRYSTKTQQPPIGDVAEPCSMHSYWPFELLSNGFVFLENQKKNSSSQTDLNKTLIQITVNVVCCQHSLTIFTKRSALPIPTIHNVLSMSFSESNLMNFSFQDYHSMDRFRFSCIVETIHFLWQPTIEWLQWINQLR